MPVDQSRSDLIFLKALGALRVHASTERRNPRRRMEFIPRRDRQDHQAAMARRVRSRARAGTDVGRRLRTLPVVDDRYRATESFNGQTPNAMLLHRGVRRRARRLLARTCQQGVRTPSPTVTCDARLFTSRG